MIALTAGISPLSRAIRFLNWSMYSHAAWIDPDDGSCWEALAGKGVVHSSSLADMHTAGTIFDLYHVHYAREQLSIIRTFMQSQLGKPYDFHSIFHFITRRPARADDQEKWFCSELVFAAHQQAGISLLLRIPAWKVYPGLLSYSPKITLMESGLTH